MSTRFVDVLALLLLMGAGAAFVVGARHIESREDLSALYWMVVGIALLRATSGVARADRANSS